MGMVEEMNYYEDKEPKRMEMVVLWFWLTLVTVFACFFIWIGTKINGG